MRSFTNMSRLLTAGAAVMFFGLTQSAQADIYSFSKDANLRKSVAAPASNPFTYENESLVGGFRAGVFDSRLKYGATTVAEASVCAELSEGLSDAPPPEIFVKKVQDIGNGVNDVGRFTAVTVANRFRIAYLIDKYLPTLRDLANSAANSSKNAGFQGAIWDLWGVGAGPANGLDAVVVEAERTNFLAEAALNADSSASYNAFWVYDNDLGGPGDGNFQNQLVWSDNPIPEPAFYQMATLLGLGGLGGLRLRRAKKT